MGLQSGWGPDSFLPVGKAGEKITKQRKDKMDFMCCDKCGSEFIVKDSISTSLRCPDCSQWVDLEPVSAYSSRYIDKGYVDEYVDFDMDNYGYND